MGLGGISGTVTLICWNSGFSFDRSSTKLEMRAKSIDAAGDRPVVARKVLPVASDTI